MKKATAAVIVLVSLVGCSKLMGSKDEAAKDGGSAATVSSASTTGATGAGSIVDKALTFLTGGPFEGSITMSMTAAGKTETKSYEVKGDKMRFDRPEGPDPGYVIIEGAKATSVDDAKKTAIVMDLNAPMAAAAAQPTKKPDIEKTGKSETIAGYSCEDWKVTEDNGNKTEACVAQGIAFPGMAARAKDWTAELLDKKYFPLKAVTTDSSGKEKSRMEVTKIEKKSIDDARFQVPAGYKVESMEDMMKAMGAAMGRHPH